MKKNLFYIFSTVFVLLFCMAMQLYAQPRASNHKETRRSTTLASNFFSQGKADSLPIQYIPDNSTIQQGRMSLRNDFPYEQAPYQQSKALKYPRVRQEDIAYSVRIWEDVDTRKAGNRSMMYVMNDMGSQTLISIILRAIQSNQLTAFDAQDDRFTTPMTPQQVRESMGNGLDTAATYDLDGNINGYQIRNRAIDVDSIYTYRVKEDWFYDKNYGRMMVRIIGIAPVVPFTLSTGEKIPNSEHPLFWIYFEDLRPLLTKYKAYNTKAPGTKIPFDELFDLRQFKGTIVKSDYDNPGEINWNDLMPDPIDQQRAAQEIRKQINQYGNDDYDMISQDTPPKEKKKRKNK